MQKKIVEKKKKEGRDVVSRDGMEVGKKMLHVAYSSLKPIMVFCDRHKHIAQTVIISPFYFYFSLGEGAKQRHNCEYRREQVKGKEQTQETRRKSCIPIDGAATESRVFPCLTTGQQEEKKIT